MSADGVGVAARAGGVGLRLLADRSGLTNELSKAMQRRSFTPVHDPGQVLADVAVMLADGSEAIADIDLGDRRSVVHDELRYRDPWRFGVRCRAFAVRRLLWEG